jgi:hypothetical protein
MSAYRLPLTAYRLPIAALRAQGRFGQLGARSIDTAKTDRRSAAPDRAIRPIVELKDEVPCEFLRRQAPQKFLMG